MEYKIVAGRGSSMWKFGDRSDDSTLTRLLYQWTVLEAQLLKAYELSKDGKNVWDLKTLFWGEGFWNIKRRHFLIKSTMN